MITADAVAAAGPGQLRGGLATRRRVFGIEAARPGPGWTPSLADYFTLAHWLGCWRVAERGGRAVEAW